MTGSCQSALRSVITRNSGVTAEDKKLEIISTTPSLYGWLGSKHQLTLIMIYDTRGWQGVLNSPPPPPPLSLAGTDSLSLSLGDLRFNLVCTNCDCDSSWGEPVWFAGRNNPRTNSLSVSFVCLSTYISISHIHLWYAFCFCTFLLLLVFPCYSFGLHCSLPLLRSMFYLFMLFSFQHFSQYVLLFCLLISSSSTVATA